MKQNYLILTRVHPKVSTSVFHKHVIFIKTVRVQQQQNSFPCCQLSLEQSKQQLTAIRWFWLFADPQQMQFNQAKPHLICYTGSIKQLQAPKLETACAVITLLKNKHNASQTLKRRLTVGVALPQEKGNNQQDINASQLLLPTHLKCCYKGLFSILNQGTPPQVDQSSPTAQGSIHHTQILFDCSK